MTTPSFPDEVFQNLLKTLANALEVAQNSSSTLNPKTRQAIYQATVEFKDSLLKAKELAENLPGGEMLIEEQNEVITLLENLRDSKRVQLEKFSTRHLSAAGQCSEAQSKMELDSTASSPHD